MFTLTQNGKAIDLTAEQQAKLIELLSVGSINVNNPQNLNISQTEAEIKSKQEDLKHSQESSPMFTPGYLSNVPKAITEDSDNSDNKVRKDSGSLPHSRNSQSGHSDDSERQTVGSRTTGVVLLRYEIVGLNINIIVNSKQRPDTALSGSQGDHVTAYSVLL